MRSPMPEQFENSEETKVEDETVSDASAQKRIERVAEKAAERAGNTVKKYEDDRTIVNHEQQAWMSPELRRMRASLVRCIADREL